MCFASPDLRDTVCRRNHRTPRTQGIAVSNAKHRARSRAHHKLESRLVFATQTRSSSKDLSLPRRSSSFMFHIVMSIAEAMILGETRRRSRTVFERPVSGLPCCVQRWWARAVADRDALRAVVVGASVLNPSGPGRQDVDRVGASVRRHSTGARRHGRALTTPLRFTRGHSRRRASVMRHRVLTNSHAQSECAH